VAYGKNENSGKALAFGEHSQKFKPLGLRDGAGSQEARPARVSGISWMSGISGIGGIGGIGGISGNSGISLGGLATNSPKLLQCESRGRSTRVPVRPC
jgi:hypothetical protein